MTWVTPKILIDGAWVPLDPANMEIRVLSNGELVPVVSAQWWQEGGTGGEVPGDDFILGFTMPTADNTGVPAGTSMTTVTSDRTYSTPGAVIEGVDHACFVKVTAPTTFRNCRFRGRDSGYVSLSNGHLVAVTDAAATGTLFERCTFNADFPRWWLNCLYGGGFTVRRCDLSAGVDGIGVRYGWPTTIEGNYFHDFYFSDQSEDQSGSNPPYWTHNDGIQYRIGADGGPHVARGNNFAWYPGEGAKYDRNGVLETGAPGTSYPRSMRSPKTGKLLWGAGVTMSPDFGPWPDNMDLHQNWFDGGTACVQMGSTGASGSFYVGQIRENRVGHDQYSYSTTQDDSYQLRWTSTLTVSNYLESNVWADFATVDSANWGKYLTVGFSGGIRIT